jgi:hypothetical protein
VSDPPKRKLSAKQILADIRSGMDRRALKRKYALSDKALDSVCARLAAKGALSEREMRGLSPERHLPKAPPVVPEKFGWRCPACSTPQATEMPECPVCGVVVEKFGARQGRNDNVLETASPVSPGAGPNERTGWAPIVISIVVFAFAGTCLLLWSTHRSNESHEVSELEPAAQPQRQAETEADPIQEDSGEPESTDKDYREVKIGDTKDIVLFQPPAAAVPQERPERSIAVPREPAPTQPEETSAPPTKPRYVTGVLRQFSSGDFKKEVVEASKTHPVLFQFYSQT